MADVLRALLVYRRDAVDAGMLPLCYGKFLFGGRVNLSPVINGVSLTRPTVTYTVFLF
jgi:hypothetical protein